MAFLVETVSTNQMHIKLNQTKYNIVGKSLRNVLIKMGFKMKCPKCGGLAFQMNLNYSHPF